MKIEINKKRERKNVTFKSREQYWRLKCVLESWLLVMFFILLISRQSAFILIWFLEPKKLYIYIIIFDVGLMFVSFACSTLNKIYALMDLMSMSSAWTTSNAIDRQRWRRPFSRYAAAFACYAHIISMWLHVFTNDKIQ